MANRKVARNALAIKLFKMIFGFYLLGTIIITGTQMAVEYKHIRDQVIQELRNIPNSYSNSIASAVWTFNNNQLQSILTGMHSIPSVVGVKINDRKQITAAGIVEIDSGTYRQYDNQNKFVDQIEPTFLSNLVAVDFPIDFMNRQGESEHIGDGTVYSNNRVVFERVKYGFMLILFNSILKTVLLWAIFLFFVKRILTEPLTELVAATQEIQWDNLKNSYLKPQADTGELGLLQNAFNEMIARLKHAHHQVDLQQDLLETRVESRTQEINKALQNLEEFNYMASHDLQEPLRTITSYTELLIEDLGESLPEDACQDLKFITQAARRMSNQIEDLQAYSRAERTELRPLEIELTTCIKTVVTSLKALIKQEEVTITWQQPLPRIHADQAQIVMVLEHLIQNAIKYRHPSRLPNIFISTDKVKNWVVISIRDNGLGIKKELYKKIFKPFQRLHGVDQFSGSGIGLAIVSRIVARHDGHIGVESTYGEGSTFYVKLPRRE